VIWLFLSVVLVLIVTNAGFRRLTAWAAGGAGVALVLLVVFVVVHRSTAHVAQGVALPPQPYRLQDLPPQHFTDCYPVGHVATDRFGISCALPNP
jgi:hypothetical protein